ncbi:GNAT family N-acetyltransferase [Photobacterium toruni]|uniref:tRNA(Met) cytidine acetyltransferase TmcA n=1 Tax=Photobacterium toruni TaxID=1935446 RepID=A0ABU6L371_9GAMM|nr:GNAT family N-acetyltransferase [Photobacterium toruni]
MSAQLDIFFAQLQQQLSHHFCRQLIVLEGDCEWATTVAITISQHFSQRLWVGDNAPISFMTSSLKQSKQWLGQEFEMVVINALQGLSANTLGALSGTVKGGGILVIIAPSAWQHSERSSPFYHRLGRLFLEPEVMLIQQSQPVELLSLAAIPHYFTVAQTFTDSNVQRGCLTAGQVDAVEAIIKVVTGHSKRPLVLSADRGRGKSAALGIAAAILLQTRTIRIAVTAPSFACAETVFKLAKLRLATALQPQRHQLHFGASRVEFVAADEIANSASQFDFIMVDEAAAIPAPILMALLANHNRLIFATTIHGYEGTGRGFEIKFKQRLTAKMPQWRSYHLEQPIRWAKDDPLESWIFKALLLSAQAPNCTAMDVISDAATIDYFVLSGAELAANEHLLSQLFGLLINAHYQTSPNDIQQLLDDPELLLIVASQAKTIIGCCVVSKEGGFDAELAQLVMQGKRRPQGHLLAQSLAAHLGYAIAAEQRCYRILRIAVADNFQQQGIGTHLVDAVLQQALNEDIDYIGTSFGAANELVDFWSHCSLRPLRLGITKDAASGLHSLLFVKPLSSAALLWFDEAVTLFSASFICQRVEQFSQLDSQLFFKLYSQNVHQPLNYGLSPALIEHQLQTFIQGGLGYDVVVASLESWLSQYLLQDNCVWNDEVGFAVAKILQKQPWSVVEERYHLVSRKVAQQHLRNIVARYYSLSFPVY